LKKELEKEDHVMLRHLLNVNYLVMLVILGLLAAVPIVGPGRDPRFFFGVVVLLAVVLVYALKLVPRYPRPGRQLFFWAGHALIASGNIAVILSVAGPVLLSQATRNQDMLALLWLAIAALAFAMPVWLVGFVLSWLFGTRQPAAPAPGAVVPTISAES
jgi:hypothetical protein